MDVTSILSELRSELEDIDRAILRLTPFDRVNTGTTKGAAQNATQIETNRPDDGS
jgi:hypothetical protein